MGEHTPQTPLDVLKAARELISAPERWTQGAFARGADGKKCALDRGHCFCVSGAVMVAARRHEPRHGAAMRELRLTTWALGRELVVEFNDAPERTHAEVLNLFDRTIARLEAEGAHD